jgi:hypothetical protein
MTHCVFWWKDVNGQLKSGHVYSEWSNVEMLVGALKSAEWKVIVTCHYHDSVRVSPGYEAAKAEYQKYVEDNIPF